MTKNPMPPELIAQLVNPSDAKLSAGSNQKVKWQCPTHPNHTWYASPNTRKRSPNCAICTNKVVIPGVNDLLTTNPEFTNEIENIDQALTLSSGSHKKINWICSINNEHKWTASIVSRVKYNAGCPICSGRVPQIGVNDLATTNPELAKELIDKQLATTVGPGSTKKLKWQCQNNPTHTWETSVRNRVGTDKKKPTQCPLCQNRGTRSSKRHMTLAEIKHPLLKEAVDKDNVGKLTLGSGKNVEWVCNLCKKTHTYRMTVRNKLNGQKCPIYTGKTIIPGINDLKTTHPGIAAKLLNSEDATKLSKGSEKIAKWICQEHHVWSAPVYSIVAGNGCPKCCPIGSSKIEKELYDAVLIMNPNAKHNIKINNYEVDILVDNLAIEMNGLFWHSTANRSDTQYHRKKTEFLKNQKLDVMTVWEDEWLDPIKQQIILKTIAYKLNAIAKLPQVHNVLNINPPIPETFDSIGARKLNAKSITGKEAVEFFNNHHIQGYTTLTKIFALFDENNTIRAAIGLRSPKHNKRSNRPDGHWEIQRYATNGIVPGGFTKLLKFAEEQLTNQGIYLSAWISLSSNESSSGKLYEKAGFNLDGHIPPNYWYTGGIIRNQRKSKEGFQLKRFISDPKLKYENGWTEKEAAENNKLYRIYDSGKQRWIKTL